MVWIYGGGFAAGATSSATYDGTRLAQKGVVLVSVAYRVGPFGFLAHPELSRESGKGSGNYGLQDMIAGLEWVKDEHRGVRRRSRERDDFRRVGRRHRGQHARRIAGREGSVRESDLRERRQLRAAAHCGRRAGSRRRRSRSPRQAGTSLFAKLGATVDRRRAQASAAEDLQKALPPGLGGGFWPIFDGDVLPADQYVLYSAGKFNDTPVLIGTNSDEGALFSRGSARRAAYEKHDPRRLRRRRRQDPRRESARERRGRGHCDEEHHARSACSRGPRGRGRGCNRRRARAQAFVYYFDHRTPQTPDGATHAAELGYVFRTLDARGGQPRAEDTAMSELVSSYWVNFAKTGDPNGAGLPKWPAFTQGEQQAMVFDAKSSARPLPNLPQLEALDSYYAWRRSQSPHHH